MKLKNTIISFISIAAAAFSFVACNVEDAVQFPVIATKQAVYEAPVEGGEVAIALSSNVSWTASVAPATSRDNVDDVTLSIVEGSADTKELKVNFGANAGFNRGAIVTFTSRDVSAAVTINQPGAKGELIEEISIADFLAKSVDASIYYQISGTVTKIAQSNKYSNFYLADETGEVYVYGLYDGKGGTQFTDGWLDNHGVKVGYTMTLGATRGQYNTTIEAMYAYVIDYAAPTTPVMSVAADAVTVAAAKTDASFSVTALNLKSDWTVTPAESYSWITDYTKSGRESGDIKITMEANEDTENERVAKFVLANADCESIELTLTQEKATGELQTISIAEFNALPDDDKNVYQIAGIASGVKTDGSDKYGNFYITDKTGTAYVYGFVGEEGGSTKNFVNVQAAMGLKDGDYLVVQGSHAVYNGTQEIKNAWYKKFYPSISAADFNALADNAEAFYTLSGKVVEIVNETYGNVYIEDETGKAYIYGILDWEGQTKNFKNLGIKVGDKITGYTIKTSYKESPQGKNMQIVLIEEGAAEDPGQGEDPGTGEETSGITTIAGINASIADGGTTESEFSAELKGAVVAYVNGKNAFIEDETGGIQLYMADHGLVAGQKISGKVTGKGKMYAGYAEATGLDVSAATVADGEIPCTVLKLADLLADYAKYQNMRVKLEGVTVVTGLAKDARDGKISQGESEVNLRAQINGVTIAEGATGDLICFPSRYNDKLQLGIWEDGFFTAK